MDVVFASTETTVIIDGREYMKGDIFPVLENEGYYFYAKDPLKRITWWIRFNQAIDASTGNAFTSIGAFSTWISANVSLPGSTGINPDVQTALDTKLTADQAAAQSDSVATDAPGIVSDFNSLLGKLRTAGIIAT